MRTWPIFFIAPELCMKLSEGVRVYSGFSATWRDLVSRLLTPVTHIRILSPLTLQVVFRVQGNPDTSH